MRNPFRRRPRVTNPPEVIPLVVVGAVALVVAQLALNLLGAVAALVYLLLPGAEALPTHPGWWLSGGALLALYGLLVVAGWKLVRRLVAGWFRRQPPQPLGPAA